MSQDIETALARFVGAFQLVFGEEWDYSLGYLASENARFFSPGTFLEPPGAVPNWGAYYALLQAYQDLQTAMAERNLQPEPPRPDEWFNYGWDG